MIQYIWKVVEDILKCDRKACTNIIEIWTEIANSLRLSLDNITSDTQQAIKNKNSLLEGGVWTIACIRKKKFKIRKTYKVDQF